MLKAVLFDWDGTLVNSKDAILQSYRDSTTEHLGKPYPVTDEEVALIIPMRAQESFGMMSDDPDVVESLIAGYHAAYLRNSQTLTRAYDGAVETLHSLLDRGLRIGVVTSKGRDRVDHDAERFGLASYVEAYVTGDVSAERKPHPGPIREALEAMVLDASEVLYVGDGPQDVIAGRGAGVRTAAAAYGFHTMDEIELQQPDHVLQSVREVEDLVQRLVDEHARS